MNHHPIKVLGVVAGFAFVFMSTGCTEPTGTPPAQTLSDSSGFSSSGTMRLNGEIISIPSPSLLATLLHRANVQFDPASIHAVSAKGNYITEQKKALNLGVYGADLAYIANYDKGQLNNDYFGTIAALAGELEILENVDKNLVSRVNANISKKDSLLALNAEFFHAADKYLKANQRGDLSGLILVGGWIEALHLSVDPAVQNAEIRAQVGDQKYSIKSIASLVSKIEDPNLNDLKLELNKLADLFNALESTYKYQRPITDTKERVTYLTSKTGVQVSDDELNAIRNQVNIVRTLITQ